MVQIVSNSTIRKLRKKCEHAYKQKDLYLLWQNHPKEDIHQFAAPGGREARAGGHIARRLL
jgi:hypothetical protein